MRSSLSGKTLSGKKAVAKKTVKAPTADEKEEYIVNLKGQVYLLTIENEMLKKAAAENSGLSGSNSTIRNTGLMSPSVSGSNLMLNSPSAANNNNNVSESGLVTRTNFSETTSYPVEINDAFEVMRHKYVQLENKYQHDIEEARRAAEALASQCAAQSSLISTLKKEIEAANEHQLAQKFVAQKVEQKANADLEVALRDISSLQDRIRELQGIVEGKDKKIESLNVTISDLKTELLTVKTELATAETARQRSLSSYAGQLIATKVVVKKLKVFKDAISAGKVKIVELTNECKHLKKRADDAESCVRGAQALQAAAEARVEEVLEKCREAEIYAKEQELAAAEKSQQVAERDAALTEISHDFATLQAAYEETTESLARALQFKEVVTNRVADLQDFLTEKSAEADDLRQAAIEAEDRAEAAVTKAKQLEEEISQANARVKALEHSQALSDRNVAALTSDIEATGQQLAITEREVVTLRDELSRRPPIDIIKALDVENLMQRNLQAASAIQQLLAWQASNEISHNTNADTKGSSSNSFATNE